MWDRNIFHGMSSKIRIFMSGAATSENALFWSSRVKYVFYDSLVKTKNTFSVYLIF